MSVLVLEAGRSRFWQKTRYIFDRVKRNLGYRPEEDESAKARQHVQSTCYAWASHPSGLIDDLDHPYTTPEGKPFAWIRARQEGGRMAVPEHGLQFYRFSDHDFKAASRDGFGVDWPISYADLRPFYDRVEREIRLVGNADDIAHLPNPVPGARIELTTYERHLDESIKRRWPDRRLIARRTAPPPISILAARASSKVTFRDGAVAREIAVDPASGRAKGVRWLEGGEEREADARVVVLAASTIESTRLLLNSRSPRHPDGIGNSSGNLGKYLMDHTYLMGMQATAPARLPPTERMSWAYVPQFRNVASADERFLRGYGVYVFTEEGRCGMTAFGEMLPRSSNRVTIDPERVDKWGIPVARIHCEHSDNELVQMEDAATECRAMLTEAGFEVDSKKPQVAMPGLAVHECGSARMGADRETSVLNSFNRCWDADNLFVVDGACFVSQGVQNPTLTMMALSLRASEHIVELCRRNEL